MNIFLDSGLLGLEYALLALGVYITFRILNVPDLTVDGSFTFGIAASAVLSAAGHPLLGLLAALGCGCLAGCITGFLQTKAGIHPILAGILTMSGLYTINITVMGSPNISLIDSPKFYTGLQTLLPSLPDTAVKLIGVLLICAAVVALFAWFFKTVFGLAVCATGNNPDMVRASSINTTATTIVALALSNGAVALGGGLVAQCQGFADINGGSGMIVIGLASVIIGEVIFGRRSVFIGLLSAVVGSILYRFIIALALETNVISANALKLISAVIVAVTLSIPAIRRKVSESKIKKGARRHAETDQSA